VSIKLVTNFAEYDKLPQRLWFIGYVTIEKALGLHVFALE